MKVVAKTPQTSVSLQRDIILRSGTADVASGTDTSISAGKVIVRNTSNYGNGMRLLTEPNGFNITAYTTIALTEVLAKHPRSIVPFDLDITYQKGDTLIFMELIPTKEYWVRVNATGSCQFGMTKFIIVDGVLQKLTVPGTPTTFKEFNTFHAVEDVSDLTTRTFIRVVFDGPITVPQ